MAKSTSRRCRIATRHFRPTTYHLRTKNRAAKMKPKKSSKKYENNKDWQDATCSVCMEYPHNAVLLLCSSHEKGCHPYMCGTSFRFSNCLEQYRKANTKVTSSSSDGQHNHEPVDSPATDFFSSWPVDKLEVTELVCPLCRGQVKGWTVVKPAREHLNRKKRSCMQDNCSFIGTYKELRKHVKTEHPSAKPREVDPLLEQKWRSLEREREREDVISTITSSMPRAMVIGDYVIEESTHGFGSDDEDAFNGSGLDENWMNLLLILQTIGSAGVNRRHDRESNRALEEHTVENSHSASGRSFGYLEEENVSVAEADDEYHDLSLAGRLRRQGRVLLGRSGQRRRRRESRQGWR